MKRSITESLALDAAIEIERFAAFDHPTRRFIAYALSRVPELEDLMGNNSLPGGNAALPFIVSDDEAAERDAAYAALPRLRACTAPGEAGARERRLAFGDLLAMAVVDLRWKRLTAIAPFLFCYERLAGPQWRELLPLCWKEAALQRRRKAQPHVQLPLDGRLREDAAVPNLLADDSPPRFYPTMADADSFGSPLLVGL